METLGKLFGSANKVKVMRLFLLNPELSLELKEVAERTKIRTPAASRELRGLLDIGLLSQKKKGTARFWQLDSSFPLIPALASVLKSDLIGRKKTLIQRFGRCGKINLLLISGVFLGDTESRTDLLLVGNNLKRTMIGRVIKDLEAEIGKELNYAVLDTSDFQYRLNACDKFVRDVLDYPHSVLFDRVGLSTAN